MAVSLQSITELSVYPWENITEPGSLLNKSDSALLMAVPLFCQGYITDILYFLQDQMVLFGGQSGFRLDQPLPLPHRSIYHDHFHCLCILWMGNILFFLLFSFLDPSFSRLNSDISWFRCMVPITCKTSAILFYFLSLLLSLFYTNSPFPPFLTATILNIQIILHCCVSVFQNVHCSFTHMCFYIR